MSPTKIVGIPPEMIMRASFNERYPVPEYAHNHKGHFECGHEAGCATVMSAYEDMEARGLLVAYVGAGSFVEIIDRPIALARIWFQDDSGNLLTLFPLS